MKIEISGFVVGTSSFEWTADDGTTGTSYYCEITQGDGSARMKCTKEVYDTVESMTNCVFSGSIYRRSKERGGGYDLRLENVLAVPKH